jgi:hypothetical protein
MIENYFDIPVPVSSLKNGNFEFVNFLDEDMVESDSVFDSPDSSPRYLGANPVPMNGGGIHPNSHIFVQEEEDVGNDAMLFPETAAFLSTQNVNPVASNPLLDIPIKTETFLYPTPVIANHQHHRHSSAAYVPMGIEDEVETPIGYRTRSQKKLRIYNAENVRSLHPNPPQKPAPIVTKPASPTTATITHMKPQPTLTTHTLPPSPPQHHHQHHQQQQQHHHQHHHHQQQQQLQHPQIIKEEDGAKKNRKRKKSPISSSGITKRIKNERDSITLTREELLSFTSDQFEQFVSQVTEVRELTQSEKNELKRQRRLIKNRESAQASRQRKKSHIDDLERRVKDLASENIVLKDKVSSLDTENINLKNEIAHLQAIVNKIT